ncbi:terminase large subunit [Acidaminococcus provencensis]|uniref:terminase large subunit n=1 Tax=Acidaminococcus provencensis TaxID=2058289 RepID=UPI0022DF68CA|nr:terminase TerL endonuclease subunit [Acidaminococcus provencensis]
MTSAIEEYNDVLQSGKIKACKKLKAVYQHLAKNIQHPGKFHFDQKAADRAVTFIETFCCIPKMRGTPRFKLELWQKALVEATFGFVDDQNLRQYREVFLFIGRKNAKSILGAAMALYLLLADGEDGPEIYTAATDRSQAKVVWEYAISMINHDASLKKYLRPKVNLIECKENGGKFVPLSKNSGSLDGLNVSGMFLDELHAIKDRNMYDVLKGGTYARSQPLTVIMSTGGYYEQDSLFDTKYSEYMSIIDGYTSGRYTDESTLPIIYELDSKEEVLDPKNWIKANPNLGVSKNPEQLEREFNRATLDEKTMRDLLVKQFNFRENARDTFFNLEDVENKATFSLDQFSGMYFFGGVDLSETTDLTCATAAFPVNDPDTDEPKLYVHQMYWIPEDSLKDHIEKDKVPYDVWIENGWVRTCPGNVIDQKEVVNWFSELQAEHNVYAFKIGYDAYNAQYLTRDLEENFGKDLCEKVAQNFKGLSSQMYLSKAWFKRKKIIYNYNPVFLWCLLNTEAVTDTQGNVKPYKNRNLRKRIDGYSSFLDAFCVYLDHKDDL